MMITFAKKTGERITLIKNGVLVTVMKDDDEVNNEFVSELTAQAYHHFLCLLYKEKEYIRIEE